MHRLFKIMLDKLNILLYNNMVVQVGEAAAPCSPQSAIVGTIFSGRVFTVYGRLILMAVTAGSRAMACREPCQVGNQAAISGSLLCAAGKPDLSYSSFCTAYA